MNPSAVSPVRHATCALLFAGLAAALTGCVYTFGTTLPRNLRTIHVPTFINQTKEPQVETEATSAARREFQRDGTLRVCNAAEADLILTATLADYTLQPISYSRSQPKLTREYRLLLTADVVLTDARSGQVLLKRRISGDATFEVAGDIAVAKIEALPTAAKQLAHNIVESVVEMW